MEHGDLASWARPRYVVVIEGVLCLVQPIEESRRLRKPKVTGYDISWYDVPLKRLLYMRDRWPNTACDLVTFISPEFCDRAADYLDVVGVPYDSIRFIEFDTFTSTLRYQQDLQSVYDCSMDRLDRYGQLGHSVMPGEDF